MSLLSFTSHRFRPPYCFRPILVAARPEAWVSGRSLAGNVGSDPAGGMDVRLLWLLCVVR
jgi:hypothetical protein